MLAFIAIAWFSSGFVGALMWCWGEEDWSAWGIIYPTIIGLIGFCIGLMMAFSRAQHMIQQR